MTQTDLTLQLVAHPYLLKMKLNYIIMGLKKSQMIDLYPSDSLLRFNEIFFVMKSYTMVVIYENCC